MTTARWAGLTYLVLIATGMFSLLYAPGQYIINDDPTATLQRIEAGSTLFKLAIVAEMTCYASFVVLAALLHKLFRSSSETLALLLVGFVVVSVAISFVALGEKMSVVAALSSGGAQASAVDAHLSQYADIRGLAELFWGLWLAPYGLLVLKSRAIPWVFGVALILGCFSYVAGVIAPLFWGGYLDSAIEQFASLPGAFGEIGGALWLTVMGARQAATEAT